MGTKLTTTQVHKRFGKQVRTLRLKRNKTQEDLAFDIGVEPSYISLIEMGKRNTTLDKIFKIADALHVEIKELFP